MIGLIDAQINLKTDKAKRKRREKKPEARRKKWTFDEGEVIGDF